MYQEDIEQWIKTELLGHLKASLAREQLEHSDSVRLLMPYAIDTSSVVGGIVRVVRDTLPQYAIDITEKIIDTDAGEDVPGYIYSGAITIMVGGENPAAVDTQVKRHAKVVEQWINTHLYPFPDGDIITTPYWIYEMRYSSTVFSGAMPLEQETSEYDTGYWVAGAEVSLACKVSEPMATTVVHA